VAVVVVRSEPPAEVERALVEVEFVIVVAVRVGCEV
jgi:hypothetical protein